MEVRFESMVFLWDDKIPTMFLEFMNLLTLCQSEEQLRASVKDFAEKHELELPDIKEVREKTGLSQNEFAARLHISPRTLQNWEQGRRYPTGPAATLIRILDAHPSLI
jgi:putative transcriptional regulator